MTQREDTKTETTKNVYEAAVRLKKAGISGLNGAYKAMTYNRLPRSIKQLDLKDKRDVGIMGYKNQIAGNRVKYYITVSVPKSDKVEESSPTYSLYRRKGLKVTKLYSATAKYGTFPKQDQVKSTDKETETTDPPLIEGNLNDETDARLVVDAFAGTWFGDEGWDTIFRIDNLQNNFEDHAPGNTTDGFVTPYSETVEMRPISFGILNPGVLGMSKNTEVIYGVRLFRRVVSTLARVDKNKNFPPPDNNQSIRFPSATTIHEETGYILFMYEGSILKRVVKSLAVPRGITVLASDETPTVVKEGDIIKINVELESKSNPEENDPWIIGNGEFVTKNGKISSFIQEISLVFNMKTPSESTFTYTQNTPITLKDKELDHFNENMLRKQA